jgi:hypothetical protein
VHGLAVGPRLGEVIPRRSWASSSRSSKKCSGAAPALAVKLAPPAGQKARVGDVLGERVLAGVGLLAPAVLQVDELPARHCANPTPPPLQ